MIWTVDASIKKQEKKNNKKKTEEATALPVCHHHFRYRLFIKHVPPLLTRLQCDSLGCFCVIKKKLQCLQGNNIIPNNKKQRYMYNVDDDSSQTDLVIHNMTQPLHKACEHEPLSSRTIESHSLCHSQFSLCHPRDKFGNFRFRSTWLISFFRKWSDRSHTCSIEWKTARFMIYLNYPYNNTIRFRIARSVCFYVLQQKVHDEILYRQHQFYIDTRDLPVKFTCELYRWVWI